MKNSSSALGIDNSCGQVSDDEENELRRETSELLHMRAGARARVEANSAAMFEITGACERVRVRARVCMFYCVLLCSIHGRRLSILKDYTSKGTANILASKGPL